MINWHCMVILRESLDARVRWSVAPYSLLTWQKNRSNNEHIHVTSLTRVSQAHIQNIHDFFYLSALACVAGRITERENPSRLHRQQSRQLRRLCSRSQVSPRQLAVLTDLKRPASSQKSYSTNTWNPCIPIKSWLPTIISWLTFLVLLFQRQMFML